MAHILAAASFGIISAGVMHYRHWKSKSTLKENNLAPYLDRTESGRVRKIETFSQYVGKFLRPFLPRKKSSSFYKETFYAARQLGFKDESECPEAMKLAYEYLKKSKGFDDKMYEYLAKEANAEELYVKLAEEFERCILGYFAFHWSQAPLIMTQVLVLLHLLSVDWISI